MYATNYEKVIILNNNALMTGYLNSKHTNWGCVVNPNGNKLQKYKSHTTCTISAPSKPTYFPYDNNRLPDILNILIIISIPYNIIQESVIELDSDHNPVKINKNSPLQFHHSNNSIIKGKLNWNIYSDYINKNLKIPTNQIAEELAKQFTDIITDAARMCSTTTPPNSYNHYALPQSILSLIQQKLAPDVHSKTTEFQR
jgi:hypothetical protein